MPDLSMPQRQTYPHIRGRVEDQEGALDLSLADDLELFFEVDGTSPLFGLPAVALDPALPGSIFHDANGVEVAANFEAPIGTSGISNTVTPALRGKLKITWDATSTPPLVQWAPKTGFISLAITENVQAEA